MITVVGYMKVIPPGNKKPQKPLIIKTRNGISTIENAT